MLDTLSRVCTLAVCKFGFSGWKNKTATLCLWRKDGDSHRGCACLLPFTVHRKAALLIRVFLMIRFDQLKILQPKLSRECLQKLRRSFSVFLSQCSADLDVVIQKTKEELKKGRHLSMEVCVKRWLFLPLCSTVFQFMRDPFCSDGDVSSKTRLQVQITGRCHDRIRSTVFSSCEIHFAPC
jgi:hypothetical protein